MGRDEGPGAAKAAVYDSYLAVLEQVLQLDDKEFEILVGHLVTAFGFEGSEVTGTSGDGGVDATGELNVANLATVKVFVQAKRYRLGSRITAGVVRQLRQAIPFGGQGAFITTADFQEAAAEVAIEPGFPRIGLSDDELAFYDALEANDRAVMVLGDDTLEAIARELVAMVRNNVTIDWAIRANVRAPLRVHVKRILRTYGYPPDRQERATQTVLEQAEVLSRMWAA